jgi:hypothetical protein
MSDTEKWNWAHLGAGREKKVSNSEAIYQRVTPTETGDIFLSLMNKLSVSLKAQIEGGILFKDDRLIV